MYESASISIEPSENGCPTLYLVGEINVFLAAELRQRAMELADSNCDIIVQCEYTASFDAASLQILLALKNAMTLRGRSMKLIGLSQDLLNDITLAGLAGCLSLTPDLMEPTPCGEAPAARAG